MPTVQVVPRVNASKSTETARSTQCDVIETKIMRYGSRYWAVYVDDELLVVTVYKKGALAVQNALS